jgi:putative ABC transport system permease protein
MESLRLTGSTFAQAACPSQVRSDEAAIIESFALAHGFRPGDQFDVLINGRKRTLSITGITLSPEHVYAIGPGDMVP